MSSTTHNFYVLLPVEDLFEFRAHEKLNPVPNLVIHRATTLLPALAIIGVITRH